MNEMYLGTYMKTFKLLQRIRNVYFVHIFITRNLDN